MICFAWVILRYTRNRENIAIVGHNPKRFTKELLGLVVHVVEFIRGKSLYLLYDRQVCKFKKLHFAKRSLSCDFFFFFF